MGLIEILYELKHGEKATDDLSDCDSHNFGPWEIADRSGNEFLDKDGEYFDWSHEPSLEAVQYRRTGTSSINKSESKARVVPYEEVRTEWSEVSGQQYFIVTVKRDHERECHCGETQTAKRPVKYVAFHCGEIIAEEEDRDHLDLVIIEHDSRW